jgi:hypothetical protein
MFWGKQGSVKSRTKQHSKFSARVEQENSLGTEGRCEWLNHRASEASANVAIALSSPAQQISLHFPT